MTVLMDKYVLNLWKKKPNCENNLELILLETYNLLDGYMGKELCLL
jgi:hypothetical protein